LTKKKIKQVNPQKKTSKQCLSLTYLQLYAIFEKLRFYRVVQQVLRCGGISIDHYVANFVQSLEVNEL